MNIPGENLNNIISGRRFVGWYNGIPTDSNLNINLDVEEAVILGQGNVAIDIARILLTPVDKLRVCIKFFIKYILHVSNLSITLHV